MEEEFSLASLAGVDVSGIEEVRFELIPMGVYVFEVIESEITEGENRDNEKRFIGEAKVKIIEVKSVLEAGVDKDSLIGKTVTEKMYINPAETQQKILEAVGRIKAMVVDMGGTWSSNLVENVANLKGLTFTAKIKHRANKDDKSIKYAQLAFDKK